MLISLQKDLLAVSERAQKLVPVRIELDSEHGKLRDCFTWNLNDNLVSPEGFSRILCEDHKINLQQLPLIIKSIQEQLNDFSNNSPQVLESKENWNSGIIKPDGETMDLEEDLPEKRIIIKLDITIETQTLVDQV